MGKGNSTNRDSSTMREGLREEENKVREDFSSRMELIMKDRLQMESSMDLVY